jgi:hypothetical protein
MAPVLFLWLQKAAVSVSGAAELAVRIVPLVAGLAVIPLVAAVVAKCASDKAALCAAALASMSPALVQHSNQAKQYSVEAAATAMLVWFCVAVVWKKCSWAGLLMLLIATIVSLLISVPSIFVVACAWASFAVVCRMRRAPVRLQVPVVCGAALSGAAFAFLYFRVYSATGNGAFMQRFWNPLYLSSQKTLADAVWLATSSVIRPVFAFDETVPPAVAGVAALMVGFGVFHMIAGRMWPEIILFAGPVVLAITASLMGKWPLGTRLMLFSAPLVLIILSKGLDGLLPPSGATRRIAVSVVLVVLLLPALRYDVYLIRHPAVTDNREMIRYVVGTAGADTVYIYSAGPNGALEWLLYSENWRQPDWRRIDAWLEFAKFLEDSPWNSVYKDAYGRVKPDLVYHTGTRREVIGVDSGAWGDATGYHGRAPSAGWADSEADRILSTRPRRVFIFAPHYRQPPVAELFASLQRRGMQLAGKREGVTRLYIFVAPDASPADAPDRN